MNLFSCHHLFEWQTREDLHVDFNVVRNGSAILFEFICEKRQDHEVANSCSSRCLSSAYAFFCDKHQKMHFPNRN